MNVASFHFSDSRKNVFIRKRAGVASDAQQCFLHDVFRILQRAEDAVAMQLQLVPIRLGQPADSRWSPARAAAR
jgi:hypothetical protein